MAEGPRPWDSGITWGLSGVRAPFEVCPLSVVEVDFVTVCQNLKKWHRNGIMENGMSRELSDSWDIFQRTTRIHPISVLDLRSFCDKVPIAVYYRINYLNLIQCRKLKLPSLVPVQKLVSNYGESRSWQLWKSQRSKENSIKEILIFCFARQCRPGNFNPTLVAY